RRAPDPLVRRLVDVCPHECRDRRCEQDRRTAGLRSQEVAQRRLDAPRPGRTARKLRRALLRSDCVRCVLHVDYNDARIPAPDGCRTPGGVARLARTELGIAEAATARTAQAPAPVIGLRRSFPARDGGLASSGTCRLGRKAQAAAGTSISSKLRPRKAAYA